VTCVTYEADGWGVGELWTDDGRVVWHEHPRPRAEVAPPPIKGWGRTHRPRQATLAKKPLRKGADFAPFLAARLQDFFAGADDDFGDVELDPDELTPFGHELAAALRAIPRGETVTYGELAALAGRPGAARAAGTFCARNHFAIFVPCHRVVGSTGLGGYGSLGLEYKRRLLALERDGI
jgi:methylated-DNA-[protein]-cysteine S-methyltransferase